MNNKLYVGNLPFSTEEEQLQQLFAGDSIKVLSVRILNDRETGRSRGFGFVEMESPEDAQKAIESLNGFQFMGRPLNVHEAREQAPRGGGSRGDMAYPGSQGGFGGRDGGRGSFRGAHDRDGGHGGGRRGNF